MPMRQLNENAAVSRAPYATGETGKIAFYTESLCLVIEVSFNGGMPHYAVKFMCRMKMERSVKKLRNVLTI